MGVVKIRRVFFTELLPDVKFGFITMIQRESRSPYSGIKRSKATKEIQVTLSAGKLIATMLGLKGNFTTTLTLYTEKGHNITAASYINTLPNLKEAIKRKGAEN